jgi:hypothetical protein
MMTWKWHGEHVKSSQVRSGQVRSMKNQTLSKALNTSNSQPTRASNMDGIYPAISRPLHQSHERRYLLALPCLAMPCHAMPWLSPRTHAHGIVHLTTAPATTPSKSNEIKSNQIESQTQLATPCPNHHSHSHSRPMTTTPPIPPLRRPLPPLPALPPSSPLGRTRVPRAVSSRFLLGHDEVTAVSAASLDLSFTAGASPFAAAFLVRRPACRRRESQR